MRLDVFLVQNKLAPSRVQAQNLIKSGAVTCNGKLICKPNYNCEENCIVTIDENSVCKYVSRGAYKLERANDVFKLDFKDKVVIDVGSSTGGFVDFCLKNDAKKVIAVDVGKNQLHESLRLNKKVVLFENTDIRNFVMPKNLHPTMLTCDVSFISLTKLMSYFAKIERVSEFICLIKPQFECGKAVATKYKGVIKNFDIHKEVIKNVCDEILNNNLFIKNLTYSTLLGGDGNIEYLVYFVREKCEFDEQTIKQVVAEAQNNFNKVK